MKQLRPLLLGAVVGLLALVSPAWADINYTQGVGTVIFDFTCFLNKHCSAHVNITSGGVEIFTAGNPAQVTGANGTFPATQSGAWTVQPGNTPNTTAWLVTGTGGVFPASQSGTWNINNITGTITLPTGAATAAKQPALGTAGAASADVLTVQGIASMTPLKTDGSGVTQPVSGTVTANAGTNLNTSLLALEGGHLASIDTKTPALGQALAASSVPVVLTAAQLATLTPLATVTANAGTNLNTSALALETGGNLASIFAAIGNGVSPAANTLQARLATLNTTLNSPMQNSGGTVGISGTLPAFTATPTFNLGTLNGAALAANQTNASQKTQIVDGSGNVIASTSNNLNVQCANCSGSGVSTGDEASFTAGTSLFAGSGGFFQTTATNNALTTGQQGMFQVTANRALFSNLRNAAGTEVGTSTTPLQVSLANTATNTTPVKTDGSGVTQPVSGTVTSNQGGAPWSVGGNVASGASDSGNPVKIGGVFNTTQPTVTNTQRVDAQMTARGAQIVAPGVDGFAVAATLNAETTKVIGTVRTLGNVGAIIDFTGQNASSPANSWLTGCQFNTAPTTITNGNASPVQCDNGGNTLVKTSDATVALSGMTALNAATQIALAGRQSVSVLLSGTFSATLTPEVSADGGTTWVATQFYNSNTQAFVSTVTATGTYDIVGTGGKTHARVRVSAFTSGTVTGQLTVSTQAPSAFSVDSALLAGLQSGAGTFGATFPSSGIAIGLSSGGNLVTPDTNSGSLSGATQRVTLATNGLAIPLWGHGATAATTPTSATASGCNGINAAPTAVTNGQMTIPTCGLEGTLITRLYAPKEKLVSGVNASAMTGTTSTQIIAAVASNKLYITSVSCANSHATVGTLVNIQDGSGGTVLATLACAPAFGGDEKSGPTPLFSTTSGNGLFAADVTTGANVFVNASGFSGP